MGVVTRSDSLQFWVENGPYTGANTSAALAITMATATSTQTVVGADQQNPSQTGVLLWMNILGSIRATSTVKLLIQAKNPFVTNTYVTIASVSASFDTTSDASALHQQLWIGKGITATGNIVNTMPNPLPRDWRAIASITVLATSTTGAIRFEVGKSMLL